MEVVIVVLVPVLFLFLAASMLVVSQFSSFFQFGKYSQRRRRDQGEIQDFMAKLATAQSQVFRRSQDLEKMTQKLQSSNAELDRLNGMKSKFLSMAVHDMRTPLASIKGFGEMLSRQELEGTQKKYVDYIVRGTDQINNLMSDLTDLAVIEAGKLRLEKVPFELGSMIRDVGPSIGVVAKTAGINFVYPENVPAVTIVGDRFRLVRVLMNFLNNAVKFTPKGGTVELIVRPLGRYITFSVKDDGPGIHPSERGLIFEKFYQSRFQDMKNKKKGWGLGLSIAQEIVRGHEGAIGVDSAGLGKGSTFWCRIPLKPSKMPARKALAAALLALGLAGAATTARAAEGLPLEEKATFEKALETRAESVLLRLLGPSRYRVVVDATLDFTRVEKFEVKGGMGKAGEDPASLFLWQNVGAEGAGRSELLPGIPSPEPLAGFGGDKSYERQNSFPSAFVKRLAVTLLLDDSIAEKEANAIGKIVQDILQLDRERGDVFDQVRVPFAPAWKTIWYQPEAIGLLFKYTLIALMTLITLVVVALCFLKLAEAMDSMAQAQAHQLQMDFGPKGEEGKAGEEGEEEKKAADEAEPGNKIYFEVKPEQCETLMEILRGQEPANFALVVAHLKPETRQRFLSLLPPSLHSEVVFHLGNIRFVEADVVSTIKEELERRLESAVGGHRSLLELIDQTDVKHKRELLKILEQRDPALARLARSRILLFEDLQYLDMRDWSVALGSVPLEDWATALFHSDDAMREAVQSQMLPKTWAIIEQMMRGVRAVEAVGEEAQERVVQIVMKLIKEGRVVNPAMHRQALVEMEAESAAAGETALKPA